MSQSTSATSTLAGTGVSIDIRNVVKTYKTMTAVDDVSLTIEPGEFLTLLGSSGSGKSTLLNIIAGFISADSGSIEVGGRDLTKVPPYRRDLGMVFQHYALFPHMSVWDNVAFPLKRRGVAKAQVAERVQRALDVVELGHLGKRRPAQLSGGQQQRVAVARALAAEPNVLLMDEPFGAVDPIVRRGLQDQLLQLQAELGKTIVLVTHDIDEAFRLGDEVVILRTGGIVAQTGTPKEIVAAPADEFVRDFIGADRAERALRTVEIDGRSVVVDGDGRPVGVLE